MNEITIIILSIVGLIVGFGLSYFAGNKAAAAKIADAEQRKKAILDEADKEAKAIKKEKLLEAKEEWHKRKQEFEADANAKRNKMQAQEKQLKSRGRGHSRPGRLRKSVGSFT